MPESEARQPEEVVKNIANMDGSSRAKLRSARVMPKAIEAADVIIEEKERAFRK
jgi:hypothetical protein